jgi:hypothetical protein
MYVSPHLSNCHGLRAEHVMTSLAQRQRSFTDLRLAYQNKYMHRMVYSRQKLTLRRYYGGR